MAINRGPFNALIDDDGSGTTGTPWNKTQIAGVLLDPIDAMWNSITPDLVLNANGSVRRNTTAGSDTGVVSLSGAGSLTPSRGAFLSMFGNQHATYPGTCQINLGNVAGARFDVWNSAGTTRIFQLDGSSGTAIFTASAQGAWTFDSTAANGGTQLFLRSGTVEGWVGCTRASVGVGTNGDMAMRATNDLYFWADALSIRCHGHVFPTVDNTYYCGQPTARWATVFANLINLVTPNPGIAVFDSTYANGGYISFQKGGSSIGWLGSPPELAGVGTSTDFGVRASKALYLLSDTQALFAPPAYNATSGAAANLVVGADGRIARSTSSRRSKTHIAPLTDWSCLLALRPVTFTARATGTPHMGLVAEEVAAVEPRLAVVNPQGEADEVAYPHLTAPLVAAIQALHARLTALERTIPHGHV